MLQDKSKAIPGVLKCPLPTPRSKDSSPRHSYDNVQPQDAPSPNPRDPKSGNQYDNALPHQSGLAVFTVLKNSTDSLDDSDGPGT